MLLVEDHLLSAGLMPIGAIAPVKSPDHAEGEREREEGSEEGLFHVHVHLDFHESGKRESDRCEHRPNHAKSKRRKGRCAECHAENLELIAPARHVSGLTLPLRRPIKTERNEGGAEDERKTDEGFREDRQGGETKNRGGDKKNDAEKRDHDHDRPMSTIHDRAPLFAP